MAIKIFIDQGHNPQNPNAGAEANGLREQDINFEVGMRLAGLLNANPNFEARTSRNYPTEQLGTSTTSRLQTRVNGANYWGADYFISIHCNASNIISASGSEAYVYRLDSESAVFAEYMLVGLHNATGLTNRGVMLNTGLFVLRHTYMPAVLLEIGYITNPDDAFLMSTDPEAFAIGIYNGIVVYFDVDGEIEV